MDEPHTPSEAQKKTKKSTEQSTSKEKEDRDYVPTLIVCYKDPAKILRKQQLSIMRMAEPNTSSEAQENTEKLTEESTSEGKGDSDDVTTGDVATNVVKKSLTKLISLPTPPASPCCANSLRRSLSYPPSSSHACRVCAGLCICPTCAKSPDTEDGADAGGTRPARGSRRQRQSGGSMHGCHRHKLASMRDSLPSSRESLRDREFMLFDVEPSISAAGPSTTVLFPRGEQEFGECQVCLLEMLARPRLCCKLHVCDGCLQWYIREKVRHRVLSVRCPNPACCDAICREEIQHHLTSVLQQKFLQFLMEDNSDPDQKTCPRCNHIANFHNDVVISKHKSRPDEQKVACLCGLLWCFRCHAPWHENISCKQYQMGDRLLRDWAKENHYGQPNANRCPKCKVYIQRSSGCDNMTCSQCHTNFCYRCGERFHYFKFFGNHHSAFSVFGCKYRLLPNKPVKRRLIRGAIFGCKIAATPVCVTLAVGVGFVLLVTLGPVFATYGACKEYKRHRSRRRRQRQLCMHNQYLEYSRQLYSEVDRDYLDLKPRAATLIDLPPSSWLPECTEEPCFLPEIV